MNTYNPQSFKKTFASVLGQQVWNYLNTEDAMNRMEQASLLNQPAAEEVGDILLQKFGIGVKNDRVKQTTGHMIRFIMESMGYHLAKRGIKCRKNTAVYVNASRYEKP